MSETRELAEALQRAWDGAAWHGPSLGALLEGWAGAQAAAHPVPGSHSAWEVLRHLTTWTEVPRRRILGEAPAVAAEEDWPPAVPGDEEAWREAVATLRRAHRRLVETVETLSDADLERCGGDGKTVRETLQGVLQHHAYHGGQLALLRRATEHGREVER